MIASRLQAPCHTSRTSGGPAGPPDVRSSGGIRSTSAAAHVGAAGGRRQALQHRLVQPRIGHLRVGAARQHGALGRAQRLAAAPRVGADAVDPDVVEADRGGVAAVGGIGQRGGRPGARSRPARRWSAAPRRRAPARSRGRAPAPRRRRSHPGDDAAAEVIATGSVDAARQPAGHLPPDGVVGAVGRGQHHAPPPRRLAGEDHRPALPVALHGQQRPGLAGGAAGHRQHLRARAAGRRRSRPTPATAAPASARRASSAVAPLRVAGWSAPSAVSATGVPPACGRRSRPARPAPGDPTCPPAAPRRAACRPVPAARRIGRRTPAARRRGRRRTPPCPRAGRG